MKDGNINLPELCGTFRTNGEINGPIERVAKKLGRLVLDRRGNIEPALEE